MYKGKFQKGFLRCPICLKWLHPKMKVHGAGEIVTDSIGRLYHNSRFCPIQTNRCPTRLRHKSTYRFGREVERRRKERNIDLQRQV